MVRIKKKIDTQEDPEEPDYSVAGKPTKIGKRPRIKKLRKFHTNAVFGNKNTDISLKITDHGSSTQMIQSFIENDRSGTNNFTRPKLKNLKQISEVRFAGIEWTPKMAKISPRGPPQPKNLEEIETQFDQCEYTRDPIFLKRIGSPCLNLDSVKSPSFLKVESENKSKKYCCSVGHNFEEENKSAKFKGERAHYRNMNETLLSWVIDDDDSDESLNLAPEDMAIRKKKRVMTCMNKKVTSKFGVSKKDKKQY